MVSGFSVTKNKRFSNGSDDVLSMSAYNLIMGLVVLYGLIMNTISCLFFTEFSHQVIGKHPVIFLIAYIGLVFAGSIIACKSDNPIVSFLGYNLIVMPIGLIVSSVVDYSYTPIVVQALKITATIVVVMIVLSCIFPKFFLSLGKALFISLIALLIASIICMLFRVSSTALSYIGAGIFSLYIGYDIQKAQRYARTIDNAVDNAINVYLDIINLFLRVLSILSKKNNN